MACFSGRAYCLIILSILILFAAASFIYNTAAAFNPETPTYRDFRNGYSMDGVKLEHRENTTLWISQEGRFNATSGQLEWTNSTSHINDHRYDIDNIYSYHYYYFKIYYGVIVYSLLWVVLHSAIFGAMFKRNHANTKLLITIKTASFIIVCLIFAILCVVCVIRMPYGYGIFIWLVYMLWLGIEGGLLTISLWLHRKKLIKNVGKVLLAHEPVEKA
jgi:hypothetical protein